MVRDLVRLKVDPIHPLLRRSAALAYTRRWWHILSIEAQTIAADCILGQDSPIPTHETDMPIATVLTLAEIAPEPSRMALSEARSRLLRHLRFRYIFQYFPDLLYYFHDFRIFYISSTFFSPFAEDSSLLTDFVLPRHFLLLDVRTISENHRTCFRL